VVFGHERHYRVFLGKLKAGSHELVVDRHPQLSAPGSNLDVRGVSFEFITPGQQMYSIVANAPIVFGREGSTEAFSDVPMLMYCERFPVESGGVDLQYTIIFSNEDGGTSTRALMARWGRTTDIEYVYRVRLNAGGAVERATFQGKDHKELEYAGEREAGHPRLLVNTRNNMVIDQGTAPVRFQLAPTLYGLASSSREKTMDDRPILYRIASEELIREGKLRPYGTVDGQKISDPRNYAIVEADVKRSNAAAAFLIRVQGHEQPFRSDLGRVDYAIDRDGWVRSAVELPPGTMPAQISGLEVECVGDAAKSGWCKVSADIRMWVLDREYRPRPVGAISGRAVDLSVGESGSAAGR
jgi:hypothetical protein